MRKINYLYIIWSIFFFVFGFLFKVLLDKYSIIKFSDTINWEINPLEIFSLLISIILAIYVIRILTKKNDIEKTQIEILINYLLHYKEFLQKRFEFISIHKDIKQPKINSECKILRKRLHSIIDISTENDYVNKNDDVITNLKEKIRDIWETLTETPLINDKERDEKLTKVEIDIIEIEKLIFELIIKLNK